MGNRCKKNVVYLGCYSHCSELIDTGLVAYQSGIHTVHSNSFYKSIEQVYVEAGETIKLANLYNETDSIIFDIDTPDGEKFRLGDELDIIMGLCGLDYEFNFKTAIIHTFEKEPARPKECLELERMMYKCLPYSRPLDEVMKTQPEQENNCVSPTLNGLMVNRQSSSPSLNTMMQRN